MGLSCIVRVGTQCARVCHTVADVRVEIGAGVAPVRAGRWEDARWNSGKARFQIFRFQTFAKFMFK